MSASQVLNAPTSTYYTTLAPNGALPAVILLQPVQALKAHSLAPKNFHTIRRCHKKPFCLKRPIRFAPKTQDP